MSATHFKGPVIAKGQAIQTVQAEAELDLTSTNNSVNVLIQGDDIGAASGADKAYPLKIDGIVTEEIASDSTDAVVQVQDSSNNTTGISITTTDGDAVDDFVTSGDASDDTALTPVDLTSEDMILKVSTAAADSSTAAGKVKFVVHVMLIK